MLQNKDRPALLESHASLVLFTMKLLGVDMSDPAQTMSQLRLLALARTGLTEDDIAAAIQDRAEARKDKDFLRADGIRDDFAAKGVLFMDSPQGTTWHPKALPDHDVDG